MTKPLCANAIDNGPEEDYNCIVVLDECAYQDNMHECPMYKPKTCRNHK